MCFYRVYLANSFHQLTLLAIQIQQMPFSLLYFQNRSLSSWAQSSMIFSQIQVTLRNYFFYFTVILLGFPALTLSSRYMFPKVLRPIQVSVSNSRSVALLQYFPCLPAAAIYCHLQLCWGREQRDKQKKGSREGTKRKLGKKLRMNVRKIKIFRRQISFLTCLSSY